MVNTATAWRSCAIPGGLSSWVSLLSNTAQELYGGDAYPWRRHARRPCPEAAWQRENVEQPRRHPVACLFSRIFPTILSLQADIPLFIALRYGWRHGHRPRLLDPMDGRPRFGSAEGLQVYFGLRHLSLGLLHAVLAPDLYLLHPK